MFIVTFWNVKRFWEDALLAANYILNRRPIKSVDSTPYELWTGRKSDLSLMRKWGCIGHVLILSQNRDKLDFKTVKCNVIGYPENSKGYNFIIKN